MLIAYFQHWRLKVILHWKKGINVMDVPQNLAPKYVNNTCENTPEP